MLYLTRTNKDKFSALIVNDELCEDINAKNARKATGAIIDGVYVEDEVQYLDLLINKTYIIFKTGDDFGHFIDNVMPKIFTKPIDTEYFKGSSESYNLAMTSDNFKLRNHAGLFYKTNTDYNITKLSALNTSAPSQFAFYSKDKGFEFLNINSEQLIKYRSQIQYNDSMSYKETLMEELIKTYVIEE